MKKKILTRALLGAPIGLTICVLCTIVISLLIGDGTYYPVSPDLIAVCEPSENDSKPPCILLCRFLPHRLVHAVDAPQPARRPLLLCSVLCDLRGDLACAVLRHQEADPADEQQAAGKRAGRGSLTLLYSEKRQPSRCRFSMAPYVISSRSASMIFSFRIFPVAYAIVIKTMPNTSSTLSKSAAQGITNATSSNSSIAMSAL